MSKLPRGMGTAVELTDALFPDFIFIDIKGSSIDGITPQISGQKKGILKEGVSNKGNLSASPLSRSGSYLGTLEKSVDFHCSFETDGSSEQDIGIPCTQPVSHDKILEGTVGTYMFKCIN